MSDRISVALATCNGANYLPDLLNSLVAQHIPPFELVASDDVSTDTTLKILEQFASVAPFEVRILRNTTRLGVADNFARTIAACSGEIIALADQDDVWHPQKLARLELALSQPNAQAAFSIADVVGADLLPLGYTMWQRVGFSSGEQMRMERGDGFAVLLKHSIVTGATLAFRSHLRDVALPIPAGWAHDAWLAHNAAARGRIVAIPEPLIAYRQHAGNVVGGLAKPVVREICSALALDRGAWYQSELNRWKALAERLESANPATPVPACLNEKIEHLRRRAELPQIRWQRIAPILREVLAGKYARYARNWGSIAIDLLVK